MLAPALYPGAERTTTCLKRLQTYFLLLILGAWGVSCWGLVGNTEPMQRICLRLAWRLLRSHLEP